MYSVYVECIVVLRKGFMKTWDSRIETMQNNAVCYFENELTTVSLHGRQSFPVDGNFRVSRYIVYVRTCSINIQLYVQVAAISCCDHGHECHY